MKFSWFPGHMRKALRQVEESVALVNVVLVMLDARIPHSSFNRDLERIVARKPCIYLLNKSDLAEKQATEDWVGHYRENGYTALPVSAKSGRNFDKLKVLLAGHRAELVEKRRSKKRLDEDLRIMVVGIPNAGKSTIINKLAGAALAKTGKKAGLTRGLQWVKLSNHVQMLDVPGIFYPRLTGEVQAWHLAAVGAAREVAFSIDDLSAEILRFLKSRNHAFTADMEVTATEEMLDFAGRKKNFIIRGNKVDYDRTAMWVITGFRDGYFGAFTLEYAGEKIESDQVV